MYQSKLCHRWLTMPYDCLPSYCPSRLITLQTRKGLQTRKVPNSIIQNLTCCTYDIVVREYNHMFTCTTSMRLAFMIMANEKLNYSNKPKIWVNKRILRINKVPRFTTTIFTIICTSFIIFYKNLLQQENIKNKQGPTLHNKYIHYHLHFFYHLL